MILDNQVRGVLIVTGSSGYIGQNLIEMAVAQGWIVRALARRPVCADRQRISYYRYELSEPIQAEVLQGADTIIHLAAITDGSDSEKLATESVEVNAAKRLLGAAAASGIRNFVFVSSQTASITAPSRYGRVKYAIEEQVLSHKGTVIRPGMVYGGHSSRGLYEHLSRLVTRLPFIPRLLPDPYLQPVAVQDLCRVILTLADSEHFGGKAFNIAALVPIRFDIFLKAIARFRYQTWKPTLPVPVAWLAALLKLIELLGINPRFDRARLASLMDLPRLATEEDWRTLGIVPVVLAGGLRRSGRARRRLLLEEGHALLSYVIDVSPTPAALKHYVRAVEQADDGQPLCIPYAATKVPCLLYGYERLARLAAATHKLRRIDFALTIAEVMPASVRSFWHQSDVPFLVTVLRLGTALLIEIGWRLGMVVLGKLIRTEEIHETRHYHRR